MESEEENDTKTAGVKNGDFRDRSYGVVGKG